jgi:hypothetical protein
MEMLLVYKSVLGSFSALLITVFLSREAGRWYLSLSPSLEKQTLWKKEKWRRYTLQKCVKS